MPLSELISPGFGLAPTQRIIVGFDPLKEQVVGVFEPLVVIPDGIRWDGASVKLVEADRIPAIQKIRFILLRLLLIGRKGYFLN